MFTRVPVYLWPHISFPLAPAFAREQIPSDRGCQSSHFVSACQSSPSLKSLEAIAIRELSRLPLSARRNQSIAAFWYSSPLLRPNCRCNIQICPTTHNSGEPPPATKQSPFHTQDGYLHAPHHREQTSSFKSSHANV